jgi:glycosyltransferase involved in cell wall biosynthesis
VKKGAISLALIVKDETKELHKLFKSLKLSDSSFPFSEIVVGWNGSNPETEEILKQYRVKIHKFDWTNDFSEARNLIMSKCEGEFMMWLDADDELVGTDKLFNVCADAFVNPSCYSVWMPYHYDHDSDGNCCMVLWRERIVRMGTHKWVAPIHESLLPTTDGFNYRTKDIYVKHNVDHERVKRSGPRNLEISESTYKRMQANEVPLDPRNIINYAKSLDAMGRYKEAIPIFEEFLRESEWDDERYMAFLQLAKLYTNSKQYHKAMDMCLHAMRLRPTFGQAYFQLAQISFRLDKWEEVLHYYRIGKQSQMPDEFLPVDPTEYDLKPGLVTELALFQLGMAEESLGLIEELLEKYPSNEQLKTRRLFVKQFLAQMELEKSAKYLGAWLEKYEKEKIGPFLSSLPQVVSDHPDFLRYAQDIVDGGKPIGQGRRIAIYCHATFESWCPETAKSKGLGGSEEAVVYLSKELVKLGWQVDVYNTCEAEGQYDGVNYYNFWRFSKDRPYEIFVAWRNNEYVDLANESSKKYVWMHDVTKSDYWSSERTKKIDKIIVLSKWHRNLFDWIKDDSKFLVSRNGINVSQFSAAGHIQRDPYKCVYASSPDRGLDVLLDIWENVSRRVEDAHLHVFYGFTHTYDKLHANNDRMIEYKEKILRRVESMKSVHYHGKVNHAELHEHFMSAGLWLYPTHFTEISCITAMKAQAAGMIPVCTTLAALDETVQYGYKVDFPIQDERAVQAFQNVSVGLLTNHEKQEKQRQEMMKWSKDFYSWENVAKEWSEDFAK